MVQAAFKLDFHSWQWQDRVADTFKAACTFRGEKMQAAFGNPKSSLHTATSQISDDGGDARAIRPMARVSCPQEQSA